MIAALPMYDRAETAAANDRLWTLCRAILGYGPEALTRDGDLWGIWQSPELLLAQTCGFPYRARLHDKVQLVATPVWDLPDESPGHYHSVIVARERVADPSALIGWALAYNEPLSQSGWAAPVAWAAQHGVRFGVLNETGAHRASAEAVAEGRADVAAIDAVTWQIMRRHDRFTDALHVIGRTASTPTLPYITRLGEDDERLSGALAQAVAALTPAERACLCLKGITRLPSSAYLAVPNPPSPKDYLA